MYFNWQGSKRQHIQSVKWAFPAHLPKVQVLDCASNYILNSQQHETMHTPSYHQSLSLPLSSVQKHIEVVAQSHKPLSFGKRDMLLIQRQVYSAKSIGIHYIRSYCPSSRQTGIISAVARVGMARTWRLFYTTWCHCQGWGGVSSRGSSSLWSRKQSGGNSGVMLALSQREQSK